MRRPAVRIWRWLPIQKRFVAVTWPPFGIFLKCGFWEEASLTRRLLTLRHEMVHWRQYQERGLFRFYWDYLTLRFRYGYADHPMEVEAREETRR